MYIVYMYVLLDMQNYFLLLLHSKENTIAHISFLVSYT